MQCNEMNLQFAKPFATKYCRATFHPLLCERPFQHHIFTILRSLGHLHAQNDYNISNSFLLVS